MRILPAAIVVSVALHGAVVLWVRSRPIPKHEPATLVTVETTPPAPVEEPPTVIELLDDHSVVGSARTGSPAGRTRHGNSDPRVATSRTTITETPPAKTQHEPKQRSLMSMRGPEIEHGPSAEFYDRFERNTKPLAPKGIPSEQRDAEIAAAESNLGNVKWIENATPEQVHAERERIVAKRYERSAAELQPDSGGGTKSEHKTFKARFNPDGTVASIEDKANIQPDGLGVSFDVTDGLMRSKGIDPYSSYKLKVLDETREERYAMGKQYRADQLAHSRQYMAQNVSELWASTQDPAARKQGLFELWDDCAETGGDELVAGGAAARTYVIGFIRTKLPAGSASAFTDDEIARFNKRRKSRETFAPYES